MRSVHLICLTALVLLLSDSAYADVACSTDLGWAEPEPAQAFAVLDRQGQPYAAFYRLCVRPHAVVEQGKVWCAYQDGEGRPQVMAYDPERHAWSGPVRASDHGLRGDTHGRQVMFCARPGQPFHVIGPAGPIYFYLPRSQATAEVTITTPDRREGATIRILDPRGKVATQETGQFPKPPRLRCKAATEEDKPCGLYAKSSGKHREFSSAVSFCSV